MALFDFLKKHDRVATLLPANQSLTVPAGEKLLNAALDAGLDWPHDCRVGSCGKCRCTLKEGNIKPLADFSYTLNQAELQAGMILACQSQLKTDVCVEITLGGNATAVDNVTGTIAAIRELTHDIREVEIRLATKGFEHAKAGQYLEISHEATSNPRSYSLARKPSTEGMEVVTFAIRHVPGGEFTDWLFDSDRTGNEVSLKGPFGDFYLRDSQQARLLCIAGGSGLAPIIALLEQGISDGRNDNCIVLFGARTQADLYYLDRLNALGSQWHGEFQLLPILSDAAEDLGWHGARGLVTEAIPEIAGGSRFTNDQAYLCGPPGMIDAAILELEKLGMPKDSIYFDKFLDASSMPAGRP